MSAKHPQIAVIGTGSMGGIYAGLFAEAGFDTVAIDTWAEHITAITENGLFLSGASGDRKISGITASTDIAAARNADLFIIATKASGVAAAASAIADMAREDALVLTIQNGLGAAERIGAHMPLDQVLLGVAEGFGASIKAPGHIHQQHAADPHRRDCRRHDTAAEMDRRALAAGRFNATAFADINQLIWEKYICNVMLSAPCTVYDCTVGEFLLMRKSVRLPLRRCWKPMPSAKARGIHFSFDDPVAYATAFAEGIPNANPSMRLDHLAGRRSEIDAINGMVPVLGAETGIETPVNSRLSAEVRRREDQFR